MLASIEKFMKERSSRQFNRLVQIGLKFVSSNFQRVLTRISAVNRLNVNKFWCFSLAMFP